jgi:hypothetical protein
VGGGKLLFFDLKVYAFADPEAAVGEVSAEARIKATGRVTSRIMGWSRVLSAGTLNHGRGMRRADVAAWPF